MDKKRGNNNNEDTVAISAEENCGSNRGKRFWNSLIQRIIGVVTILKSRRPKKYESFFFTFIFTYIITILFVVLVVFKQYEDSMVSIGFQGTIWDFIGLWPHDDFLAGNGITDVQSRINYSFGYCSMLSPSLYLSAKIMETLLPTTLTLCGITLVTGRSKKGYKAYGSLVLLLFVMIMFGMFFMVVKLETMLRLYMYILLGLFCLSIIVAASIESKDDNTGFKHKKEYSDGKFCR